MEWMDPVPPFTVPTEWTDTEIGAIIMWTACRWSTRLMVMDSDIEATCIRLRDTDNMLSRIGTECHFVPNHGLMVWHCDCWWYESYHAVIVMDDGIVLQPLLQSACHLQATLHLITYRISLKERINEMVHDVVHRQCSLVSNPRNSWNWNFVAHWRFYLFSMEHLVYRFTKFLI